MSDFVSAVDDAGSLWPAEAATVEQPGLRIPPVLTSWRPNSQLSAIETYGRFEILGRIGRGGMAEILLARERSAAGTLRHLVVKRMLPENAGSDEMLHMFLAEARVVMGLSHPHLCQIYEVGEHDGTWFIAMEWVNGVTLHQLLKRAYERKYVDYAVLARVLAQCAEALHYAHTARDADGRPLKLVHRDVSPHNLMIGYDGRVKLLDFGIAKSTASIHRTETGIVKGKVCYMAPEQWRSETLDGRADIFGLGACLYEVLTGQIAFRRDTQGEVMRAICDEPLPRITDVMEGVPEALSEIAHRALAKDPDDRFRTALEMSEALERFAGDLLDPVNSARIADYARRLFASEVALGPMLERAVRGAELQHVPMLPPVPRQLRELDDRLRSERPSLRRLLGNAPLPAPPAMPFSPLLISAPSEPVATPSRPPLWESFEPLRSSGNGLHHTDPEAQPRAAGVVHSEREVVAGMLPHVPSAFSEAPTRPMPGLSGEIPVHAPSVSPAATQASRVAGRTQSMQAALGLRPRAALALAATLFGGLLGFAVYDSMLSQRTSSKEQVQAAASQSAATSDMQSREAQALAPNPARLPETIVQATPDQVQASSEVAATSNGESQRRASAAERRSGARRVAVPSTLSIQTQPWTTVYLGRRVLGTTPLTNVSVPRGPLKLKLVDREGRVYIRHVGASKQPARSASFELRKPKAR